MAMARTAALLVIIVVAHALLMSGCADAAVPQVSASSTGHHHHASGVAAFADDAVTDDACAVGQAVVVSPVSRPVVGSDGAGVVLDHQPAPVPSPAPGFTIPPLRPPDAARAFLQVYRI